MSSTDNGFLKLDNSIIDYWMSRLNHSEFKTLLAIYRKTIGWNKQYDKISHSQIADLTGLTTRSVRTAIASLEHLKLTLSTGSERSAKVYSVNTKTLYNVCLKTDEIIEMEEALENISQSGKDITDNVENISSVGVIKLQHKRHPKDTNKIKVKETACTKENINIPFSDFWTKYDYYKGLESSVKDKWDSLSDEERALTMESLDKYLLSTPDKTYRKFPMTYLNTEAWNDEVVVTDNRNNAKTSGYNYNNAGNNNAYSASHKEFKPVFSAKEIAQESVKNTNSTKHTKEDLESNLDALGYCSGNEIGTKNTVAKVLDDDNNYCTKTIDTANTTQLHWSELKAQGLLKTKVNPNAVAPNTDTDKMINDFLARNSSSRCKDKICA